MKRLNLILMVAALIAEPLATQAININDIPGQPQLSTVTTTNLVGTNTIVSGTSKGVGGNYWTNAIIGGSYTNLTQFGNSQGTKDLAGQFQFSITATNAQTVQGVWQLARNLSGMSTPWTTLPITNYNGSPAVVDLFMQITNTVPANSTMSDIAVFNLSSIPLVTTAGSKILVQTSAADGGIPFFYVYSFSLLTNGVAAGPTIVTATNLYGWVQNL